MLASSFLGLFVGASLVSAAAVPRTPRVLSEHDIILFSKDGRVEVRNRTEYPLLDPSYVPAPSSSSSASGSSHNSRSIPSLSNLNKRDTNTIIIPNDPQDFLNWDVAMSSVVHATTSTTTVAVTQGYSIANTITVGVSSQLTLIEDFLSTTLSINYAETWTSTYTAAYTFAVPEGKYGAVVSNPKTHRESGAIFSGRIGSEGDYTTYTADSYSSKAYDSLSWVDGVISLCTGDTYPLPRCLGDGTL